MPHSASDHGYVPPRPSCIACRSTEQFCCDGNGKALPDFVRGVMAVRSRLMHARRFGPNSLQSYRSACVQAEGDLEELFIDHGYQRSTER